MFRSLRRLVPLGLALAISSTAQAGAQAAHSSTQPPGVFTACGYATVLPGYDCPSLPQALASAQSYNGAATVELHGGPFCPVTIPSMSHDLTLVGVGLTMFPPGTTPDPTIVDGPEAAISSFRFSPTYCSADVGFINIASYPSNARVTLRNLAVDGTGGGSIRGLQVTGTNLIMRDVLVENLSTIGMYYSGFDQELQVDNSAFINNGTGVDLIGEGSIDGTTIDGNTNEGLVASGDVHLANDTISHNATGVYINGYGNTVAAANTIVGDNTITDCGGTVSGDWETGGSGHNLLGARCFTLDSPSTDIALTDTLGTADLHGGPTPSVLPTQQAIGTADPGWCSGSYGTDQREGVYPLGGPCDIGAVTLTDHTARIAQPSPATTLDIGDVAVGTVGAAGVTMSNGGGDLLGISQVGVTGAGFAITRDGCTYQQLERGAGNTCAVGISVTPTARGPMTGSVYFVDDAGGQSIALTAEGTAPATVATAPTAVTASGGNAAAHLHWTAPADTGGADLTGYDVRWSTNGTTWTPAPTAAGTSTTRVLTGLANGHNYAFEVAARNAVGLSPWSAPSATVRVAIPQHPTRLTAGADRTITVGDDIRISSVLTDTVTRTHVPGVTITLKALAYRAKSAKVIGRVTTNSAGVAAMTVRPATLTSYRWYFDATPAYGRASDSQPVHVAAAVQLASTATRVRPRQRFTLYGTVSPAKAGSSVRLQQLIKGTWTTLSHPAELKKQTLPDGRTTVGFVFTRAMASTQVVAMRVAGGGGGGLSAGTSKPLTIAVTRH